MENLGLDRTRTAVLAMDCQAGLVPIYAKPPEEFIERAASVVRAARQAGILVIHVKVGFREGLPEVGTRNKFFAGLKASPEHQRFFLGPTGAIHPALGPEESDIVVVKHRIGAFAGTDLEMILRAKDIDTLVMFGIATSGVVLSTMLEAGDKDFDVVVVGDCCADLDVELHRALVERFFGKRGRVATAAELVGSLG